LCGNQTADDLIILEELVEVEVIAKRAHMRLEIHKLWWLDVIMLEDPLVHAYENMKEK
jgi:hypothetical protein